MFIAGTVVGQPVNFLIIIYILICRSALALLRDLDKLAIVALYAMTQINSAPVGIVKFVLVTVKLVNINECSQIKRIACKNCTLFIVGW